MARQVGKRPELTREVTQVARKSELRIGTFTDDDGIARIGLSRVLLADDKHAGETRTKGGIWIALSDREALTHARDRALDFAQALDTALSAVKAPKASKPAKAPKAPTPPTPAQKTASTPTPKAEPKPEPKVMCGDTSHAENASAGAKFCPLCGKDLSVLVRDKAVVAARASKPAPAPRVGNPARDGKPAPAPTKSDSFSAADWANLVS